MKVKYHIETNTYTIHLGYTVKEISSAEFKELYASMILAYVNGIGEDSLA